MRLWIPSRLPGMNEIIGGQGRHKNNWNAYNQTKQKWQNDIKLICQARHVSPQPPSYVSFLFIESNQKRDPDNICSGGIKLILDSLVGADVLEGDGWKHVLGLVGYWKHCQGRAGCLVAFDTEKLASRDEMLSWLEKENGDANKTNRK